MAKFTAHSVKFDYLDESDAAAGQVIVGAITSADNPLNTETRGGDGGGLYDYERCTVAQLPEITITTKCVPDVLKLCGMKGVCFHEDETHPGIVLYGQLVDECGTGGPGYNMALLYPRGLFRPVSLQVGRTDDATITFAIDPITDGTVAPVSLLLDPPLPTSPISSKYAIGASRVGGSLFNEPTSYNLDFGLTLTDKLPAVGNVWPEVIGVKKVQPMMGVRGQDPMLFDVAPWLILGDEVQHNETKFFLKKRAKLGAFEAANAAVHFAITMYGTTVVNNAWSSSGDSVADFDAKIEGMHDGSNAPLLPKFDVVYSSIAA